jgi:hypothetical protein
LVLGGKASVAVEQVLLRGAEKAAADLLRSEVQLLDVAGGEAEELVARNLEDVGSGVDSLGRQPLAADLDVGDRVSRGVAEGLDDVALREAELGSAGALWLSRGEHRRAG